MKKEFHNLMVVSLPSLFPIAASLWKDFKREREYPTKSQARLIDCPMYLVPILSSADGLSKTSLLPSVALSASAGRNYANLKFSGYLIRREYE